MFVVLLGYACTMMAVVNGSRVVLRNHHQDTQVNHHDAPQDDLTKCLKEGADTVPAFVACGLVEKCKTELDTCAAKFTPTTTTFSALQTACGAALTTPESKAVLTAANTDCNAKLTGQTADTVKGAIDAVLADFIPAGAKTDFENCLKAKCVAQASACALDKACQTKYNDATNGCAAKTAIADFDTCLKGTDNAGKLLDCSQRNCQGKEPAAIADAKQSYTDVIKGAVPNGNVKDFEGCLKDKCVKEIYACGKELNTDLTENICLTSFNQCNAEKKANGIADYNTCMSTATSANAKTLLQCGQDNCQDKEPAKVPEANQAFLAVVTPVIPRRDTPLETCMQQLCDSVLQKCFSDKACQPALDSCAHEAQYSGLSAWESCVAQNASASNLQQCIVERCNDQLMSNKGGADYKAKVKPY